jgi:hypothetical protein
VLRKLNMLAYFVTLKRLCIKQKAENEMTVNDVRNDSERHDQC